MKVTVETIKNTKQDDKPNEDAFLCNLDRNFFVLLDGVSRDNERGRYPNPSPAIEAVEILRESIAEEIILHELKSDNALKIITDAIQIANEKVYLYNLKKQLLFAAGAVGIVISILEDKLFFAYIGDCYGRAIYENEINVFTEAQTSLIVKHKKEFSAYEIRKLICNNIEHPYSYGVLNGDKRAINFLKTGTIDFTNVNHVILTTDGMEDYLSQCSIEILKTKDAHELIKEAVMYENVKQDDRTIIKIDKWG